MREDGGGQKPEREIGTAMNPSTNKTYGRSPEVLTSDQSKSALANRVTIVDFIPDPLRALGWLRRHIEC